MTEATAAPSTQSVPFAAAALAYCGAAPLVVAALMTVADPDGLGPEARRFMVVYGGVIIAFFGGVRWGVAVMRPEGPSMLNLIGGAIPLLLSLPIFYLASERAAFILILIALPFLLADDLRATRKGSGAPDWYLGVRTPLTALMLVAYLVALVQMIAG